MPGGQTHPKDAKVAFAQEIAARFQGEEAGRKAAEDFEKRFAKKELDAEALPLAEVSLGGAPKVLLTKVLAEAKLAASATKARKLMAQGGVRREPGEGRRPQGGAGGRRVPGAGGQAEGRPDQGPVTAPPTARSRGASPSRGTSVIQPKVSGAAPEWMSWRAR